MSETSAVAHSNGAAATAETKARLPQGGRGQIVPTLALWNHAARIGGGLTPETIANIIRDGDTGDTRRLIDLANECRQQDSHLQAVLSTSEESIAGLEWQVVPPEKARAKDKRAAAWCQEQLQNTPGFQSLLAHQTGAFYIIFAVSEIVWRRDGARIVPDRFVPVAPRRFRFRRADGVLVLYDDGQLEIDLQEKHPNKFIFSRPRVNGDVPNREGLCRPLVWMSVMRRWTISDWLSTGEMSWKPWRIATYNKDKAAADDRADLETILRRMTTDFTAVIPDSTKIDIQWPAGATSRGATHSELCTALANEMSKAVLGQTETTQSSSSSGYAQAKVHDAVRRDLLEARARQIAADITRDLIAPMVRLNFGESVAIPRFEFITQDPIDLKAFAEAVATLKDAGARIPEKWALEEAGIPEPKDGERVLGEGENDDDADDEPKGQPTPTGGGRGTEEVPETDDDA